MSQPVFDRNKSFYKFSWSYKVFQMYLEEINDFYWSLTPMLCKEVYLSKQENLEKNSIEFFCAKGDNIRRIPATLDEWRKNILEFHNWYRLNALIASISSLETYLSSVCKVAFESNPSLLTRYIMGFGFSEKTDGVYYLKQGAFIKKEYRELVGNIEILLTKGNWSTRSNTFYKIFPDAPTIIKDNISSLDKIRELRNNSAHALGRNIEIARYNRELVKLPMERLSEKRLQEYLKLINGIATEVDYYLLNKYIGSYESIYFYHKKYVEDRNITAYDGQIKVKLKKELSGMSGIKPVSKTYIKDLIEYYHSI